MAETNVRDGSTAHNPRPSLQLEIESLGLCSGVFSANADCDELSEGLPRVLWSEFKAAEAEMNAAGAEGPMPDDHPARLRWIAARDAIVSARHRAPPLLPSVLDGFDPGDDDEAMLAHRRLPAGAMAGRAAA